MAEINQAKSTKGGRRAGAGRKKGSCSVKTREIADKAIIEGITPLEYLLSILRDESQPQADRVDAAKSAAPYVHAKLMASEHTGKGGAPLFPSVINIVGA